MGNLLINESSDSREAKILNILQKVGISDNNMEVAVEFFDISKEMNLELLEELSFQEINPDWPTLVDSRTFLEGSDDLDETEDEYRKRYILFLDAMGLHTVGFMFVYNMLDTDEKTKIVVSRVTHALSLKYSPEMVQAKMVAMVSGDYYRYKKEDYAQLVWNMAEKNPMILFWGAKYCCQEQSIGDRANLCSLGLMYMEPLETNETVYEDKDLEDIKYSIAFIKEQAEIFPIANEKEFYHIMVAGFMSIHHDTEIREIIDRRVRGNKQEFLIAVLKDVPVTYFAENIDILFEMFDLDGTLQNIKECIKILLSKFDLDDYDTTENNPNIFLENIAKRFPEQFINVMNSTEEITRGYFSLTCFCNYYEYMYKILEKVNPESIKAYHVTYEEDVLRLAVETEKGYTKTCKEEISRYLYGEDNVFHSEEEWEQLREGFVRCALNNSGIISAAIRCNAKFEKHYYILKATQDPRRCTLMSKEERILDMLISENIPMATRFRAYERICDEYYYDESKIELENKIVDKMISYKESWDREYEKCCLKGGVFTRKVYLRYLAGINDSDMCKDRILAMSSDSSKEIRRLVVEIVSKHKVYEEDVLNLLKAKKQAAREVAVDVLAIWGAGSYIDILLKAQESEKSVKLAEKIGNIVHAAGVKTENKKNKIPPLQIVENLHKGGRNKKILWLYETPNKVVHFKDGGEADDKYMQAVLLCYANMTKLGINENAMLLTKELNEEELIQYALGIFTKWQEAGAEAKKKWVLYFTSIHGGRVMMEVLLQCIKEWAENLRGSIAAEAVRALTLSGCSEALMHVDNMAHKFKKKQVKNAAIEALDNAAEEFGITAEELADRIVPDLGFNENMERIFDYGPRKFKVYLSPALELEIFDEDNKKRKSMPAPSKKDDEEIAKQSNTEFKQMKKQLKSVIAMQKLRLEVALLADRRWSVEAWQNLFVKNPVMHSFAIGLIWAAYEGDKLAQTFRYMEDGSFNTSEEEEYTLSEHGVIGLVHPMDLSEEELLAWKEQLSDYEIVQPIGQLERTVYEIEEEEIGKFDLKRFHGRKISGLALLGRMEKLGWYKGSIQDGGWYHTFYREDVVKRIKNGDGTVQLIGNAVELNFSGMGVGYYDDEEVTIENMRFYTPGTVKRGSYVYDKADDTKAIKLDQINPRYFSEIVNQMEIVLKNTRKENE